ncbi:MAG: LptF/LptG family permease [Cyclobacteriaceae bacterium]
MRRLDTLMLRSFVGPFLLTTTVSNFILLVQYLLKYFDDFVGKNLGIAVFAELLFYFSMNMLQIALPLGVLVASLMTFGNLGENFELTAIKSSGISLLRVLRPVFVFVFFLSIGAYFFNNYAIPAANLKAYSLLYDIKHTKPALDIKAGAFYNGIPDYSIKAKDKLPDGKTLLDVIIYDHTKGRGNQTIILADSSLMYTIMDDRYLKLELYNGNYYSEKEDKETEVNQFYRTEYYKMDMVFSLSSFDLTRRKEELFQNNRQMKNIDELTVDIDSFATIITKAKANLVLNSNQSFHYHIKNKQRILEENKYQADTTSKDDDGSIEASLFPVKLFQQEQNPKKSRASTLKKLNQDSSIGQYQPVLHSHQDSIRNDKASIRQLLDEDEELVVKKGFKTAKETKKEPSLLVDTLGWDYLENRLAQSSKKSLQTVMITAALNQARNIKVNVQSTESRIYRATRDKNLYTIEKFKKYAQALACILMFMIGAPLGAIIKKGGLGMPTIIAILFFIIYYVFTSIGEKSAKEGAMNPYLAVWMSDLVLLPFGLFFLRQARIDARLFDPDFYHIWIEKLSIRFAKNKKEV